jgi:hypothetical protein
MGKRRATFDLTPEHRTVMEEWWRQWRERLVNLPRQTEDEREGLRQIGEYLGITPQQVREIGKRLGIPWLPEPETEPPQEPTPPKRKQAGGRPSKFTPDQLEWLGERYGLDLKANPELWDNKVADVHVRQLAKDKFGIEVGPNTTLLLTRVIRPARRAARQKLGRPDRN